MGFDCRTSTGLEETDSILGGHKQNLMNTRAHGKEQRSHRRLNQTYLLALEGLLGRRWLAGAHRRDRGTGCSRPGRWPPGVSPLGGSVSSVAQLCLILCDPMDCNTLGFPAHHQFPEFTQTHVHRVGDDIQPSHPLSSPSPSTYNLFQHQGLFQRVSSSHQVDEFQLQHKSFQ